MSNLGEHDFPKSATSSGAEEHTSSPNLEFVSLFLADQRRIHRYIVTLLSGQQDAEDLLQETAAVLWRKFHEFQAGTSFFSWACKTAYLLVLEYRRRKGREFASLDNDVLQNLATLSTRDDKVLDVRIDALQQCLSKLTPQDRQLVQRCYAAKVKAKSVAVEMGRPEKSIYRSLGRIRRALIECVRRLLASAEREGGGQ